MKELTTISPIKASKAPFTDPLIKAVRNLVFQTQFIENDPHGLNGTT